MTAAARRELIVTRKGEVGSEERCRGASNCCNPATAPPNDEHALMVWMIEMSKIDVAGAELNDFGSRNTPCR